MTALSLNLSNHPECSGLILAWRNFVKKTRLPGRLRTLLFRYSQILNGFAIGASALPSVGRYTTSVRLPNVNGVSASIDSTFKEKHTDHSVTGGYSVSIENYQFYTSLSKQFGASDNMSYSLGASRRLFNDSRVDLFTISPATFTNRNASMTITMTLYHGKSCHRL